MKRISRGVLKKPPTSDNSYESRYEVLVIRLYMDTPLFEAQDVFLNEAQSHYIQKVMRLKEGDQVLLFNGSHGEWAAKVTKVAKKTTTLLLLSQTRPQQEEGDVWILFSPLKPKRQAFLEEKATELGASCLWPIRCERTSVPHVNLEKTQAHVIEAAEQCGRLTLPLVKPLTSLVELLKNWPSERILLFGDETFTSPSLGDLTLDLQKPYAFLVGPEGGFTPQELSLLQSHPQAQGVTLNPHILRAETAALVGISWLKLHLIHKR